MKLLASLVVLAVPAIVHADPDSKKPVAAKPAPELAELGAAMAGTWKCVGKASTDGTNSIDTKATISTRMDLDAWWIQTNFTATIGKETYKFTGFTGYNHAEKKFYRHMVDNMGGSETDTATAIDHGMAGKWAISWTGEQKLAVALPDAPADPKNPARAQAIEQARAAGILGAHDSVMTKHTESMSKDGLAITGEMSMDGGKTWVKSYDATCTQPKK